MIEYHADDFGLFPEQSRRILQCAESGVLNGISIIPNSIYLEECIRMAQPYWGKLKMTVHLNFTEGHALSKAEEIPLLVDKDGIFNVTFVGLLLDFVHAKALRAQLKKEIRRQINAVKPYFETEALRIDGHAHYHMLPVVFDALMEVIHEDALPVDYIRIPRECISRCIFCGKELEGFHPINLVKTIVLRLLAGRNCRKYRVYLAGLEKADFLGVMFSGNMSSQNTQTLLSKVDSRSNVEVLFHPGGVYEAPDIAQLTNKNDIHFLTSEKRRMEADALCQLQERRQKVCRQRQQQAKIIAQESDFSAHMLSGK